MVYDAFRERMSKPGAPGSGLGLAINEQSYESLVTSLSGTVSRDLNGRTFPYVLARYSHEFRNDNSEVVGHFIDDPNVVQCDAPDAALAASGSYPSGHGAGGWAWALVMAELVPSRADAILQRGRDYGDSRVICGYHFPSDIEAGRVIAAAVIARLHADAKSPAPF